MDLSFLLTRAALLIPFIFALSVHECAHAWTALMLGDDTAQRMGRLTLNPVVHVHPIGTLLLPLLGVPFGWARPVPVDPSRFGPQVTLGTGVLLTSLAGPMSNLALALSSGVVLRGADALQATLPDFIGRSMEQLIQINVALALFNLLPFPPLDGGRVVEGLIPFEWRGAWDRFSRVGIFSPGWSPGSEPTPGPESRRRNRRALTRPERSVKAWATRPPRDPTPR